MSGVDVARRTSFSAMYTLSYGQAVSPSVSSKEDKDTVSSTHKEDYISSRDTLYNSEDDLSMMMPEYRQRPSSTCPDYRLLEYPEYPDLCEMMQEEYLESGVILNYRNLQKVSTLPPTNTNPRKAWLPTHQPPVSRSPMVNHVAGSTREQGRVGNHGVAKKEDGQNHQEFLLQPQSSLQYSPPAQKFLPGHHVIGSRARFEIQSLDPTFTGIPGTLKNREDSQKKKFSKMFRWERRPSDKHREFVDLLQFPKGNK